MEGAGKRLGFWAALVAGTATLASAVALVTASFDDTALLAFALWLVLAIAFVVVMASLHGLTSPEARVLALTALAFALIYATIVSFNYGLQLTFVRQAILRGDIEGLGIWAAANPSSPIFATDIVGYLFQGLATLAAAFLFGGSGTEKAVKVLFIVNGVMGIGGVVAVAIIPFGSNGNQVVGLGLLVVWAFVLGIAMILTAVAFRQRGATTAFRQFGTSALP